MIINDETAKYIAAHAADDIRTLALKKVPEGVDLPLALTQIDGRQRATKKLPSLAATDGIVYPPHISLEQCSSELTAIYKAELAKRLCGESLIDLTGGFGIDFIYMSKSFTRATYVERQEILCDVARENFALLGMDNAHIINADGTEYLKEMQPTDIIYIDPARRDKSGARTFAISDCTPDVLGILPELKAKSQHIIIKLSPMLDWRKAVSDLGGGVSEVHIVSAEGECKELLLVVGNKIIISPTVHCVNLGTKEKSFVYTNNSTLHTPHSSIENHSSLPTPHSSLLYIPNPSIMKAGCFNDICERYGVQQVSANSHIFLSDKEVEDFPGKCYAIDDISTMNKRELRQKLADIKQANIATRNFPLSPVELRKKLKLADGGDTYIFATTTSANNHILFICRKA